MSHVVFSKLFFGHPGSTASATPAFGRVALNSSSDSTDKNAEKEKDKEKETKKGKDTKEKETKKSKKEKKMMEERRRNANRTKTLLMQRSMPSRILMMRPTQILKERDLRRNLKRNQPPSQQRQQRPQKK